MFYGAPDKTESESRFELLYQNYKHPMQQAAFGILNDRGLAEDAVQEAFIRMGRNMERVVFADEKQAGKFLMVLARNAAIDIYRKRSRQMKKEILVNEMEEMELFTEDLEADLDEDERVQKLLGKIPVKYRDVLFMKYSHCMENGEIAKTLGISEENVRQRITRGKKCCGKFWRKWRKKGMGKPEVTDEWLYKMMPLCEERLMQELKAQTDYEYQFSERFEKNMNKLIRKVERREKIRRMGYPRTVAAAACIAVLLCATGGVAYAVGMKFFSVKKTPSDLNMTRYTYSVTEDVPMELEMKEPGYIPEGYELVEKQESSLSAFYTYQNGAGEYLTYAQDLVVDGRITDIDNEYDWKEEIETIYGTVSVQRYTEGDVFCYLEYMNCTFTIAAVNLDNADIKHIYEEWLSQ